MKRFMCLVAALALAAEARAADLDKVERRIAKEPVYQTKAPRYCLLVFGEDASPRVWLVLDGDTLYIDRNGNGDLTDKDEKVALPEFKKQGEDRVPMAQREIMAGSIRTGKGSHDLMLMQIRLAKDAKPAPGDSDDIKLLKSARDGLVTGIVLTSDAKALIDRKADSPEPTMQMALVDDAGLLEFSDRPETAPIVHFNGPLQMAVHPFQKLVRGQESNLAVGIGTPGLGKGTFAMRGYQGVPADAQPVVDIEFPHKDIKAAPIKLRVTLKERC